MHILLYTHSDYFDILPIQLEYFKRTVDPYYSVSLIANQRFEACAYPQYVYPESLPYSSRIRMGLDTIDSEFVLVLHENDIVLQLDPTIIRTFLETMKDRGITSLELKHDMRSIEPVQITPELVIAEKRLDYMFSVQPTIWVRQKLVGLLAAFPNETYRTMENPGVHDYVRKHCKAMILQTQRPMKTIWYTVDPCFVFLHLTSRLLLLPCRDENGIHPDIHAQHKAIYTTYLQTSSREVQPTLYSFLNHKVEQECLQTV